MSSVFHEDGPLLIGGLLVVGAIFFATRGGGAPAKSTSVSYQTIGADPNVLAAESAATTAKYGAVTSILSSALGYEATTNTNATQLSEAQLAASTQTTLGAYTAEYSILNSRNSLAAAQTQYADALQASQTASADQLSAQQAQAHASQQNGFWGSLFGGLGSVAKLIPGFSGGSGGSTGADMGAASFGSYA